MVPPGDNTIAPVVANNRLSVSPAGENPAGVKVLESVTTIRLLLSGLVKATLLAAEKGGRVVYNAGSGQARSFNDVIATLNKALKTRLDPDYFDNPYAFYQEFTEADLSRTRRDLGYKPAFTLEAGVADYVKRLGG